MKTRKLDPRHWSDAEVEKLMKLGADSTYAGFAQIGALLGRGHHASYMKFNAVLKERAQAALQAKRRAAPVAPAPRSITAELFGDPLPGRSALDRRHLNSI